MRARAIRPICTTLAVVVMVAGPATAQQHVEGQTGPGALYALDLPEAWNGDLVVYAHGIVDPVLPVALPSSQDNFIAIRDTLLARGYAVASSSFSENGFALKDAVQRTHQLAGLFTSRFSHPRRVLLAGHSLGSMAALQLAETYPTLYDGALVMCGFVGGIPVKSTTSPLRASCSTTSFPGRSQEQCSRFLPTSIFAPGRPVSMPSPPR